MGNHEATKSNPEKSEDIDPQMIENLDFLLSYETLKNESDWTTIQELEQPESKESGEPNEPMDDEIHIPKTGPKQ